MLNKKNFIYFLLLYIVFLNIKIMDRLDEILAKQDQPVKKIISVLPDAKIKKIKNKPRLKELILFNLPKIEELEKEKTWRN